MCEQAYYEVKDMMFQFLRDRGQERPEPRPTNKSNAKYYYRQAVRYGDRPAAERHRQKFLEFGGQPEELPENVKLAHPLAGLSKTLRYDFRQSLTDEQEKVLEKGIRWYRKNFFKGD